MPTIHKHPINLPLDWYQQMRATQPVYFESRYGCWLVFRYNDALRVFNDPITFSSEPRAREAGRQPSILGMDDPRHHQLRAIIQQACERYNDREPLATRKVSHSPKNPLYLKEISSERRKKRCIPWHFEMKFAPGS